MKKELEKALNNTANMRDNNGTWIKVGTFIYENRTYGFIKQDEKITVRCIDLSPSGDYNNMYPNLNVEFQYSSDAVSDDDYITYYVEGGKKPAYIVTKIT